MPDGGVLEFPYNQHSNLPFMILNKNPNEVGLSKNCLHSVASNFMSVLEQTNQNITATQKELLKWHHRLGHLNFSWCQALFRIPRSDTQRQIIRPTLAGVPNCEPPLCAACSHGKQERQFPSKKSTHAGPSMKLREGCTQPGDTVSIDQYTSSILGRLPNTAGREQKHMKLQGGTLFVDHASGYVYTKNQVCLTAGETLRSKKIFEQFSADHGIKIKKYHADNAPFAAKEFIQNLKDHEQEIDFSGVGAHFQNGVAERAIKTITYLSRTMLLHSILMWPDQANLELWPFAFEQATWIWNNTPRADTRIAPVEIFTKTRFPDYHHLNRLHVWGCPVYVLDPRLQDGKKIPKWSPRSRRGQYLGMSPLHSTNVGNILNLNTGYISPQYHVVYDDCFTTVPNSDSGGIMNSDSPLSQGQWDSILKSGWERIIPTDADEPETTPPLLHPSWDKVDKSKLEKVVKTVTNSPRGEIQDNKIQDNTFEKLQLENLDNHNFDDANAIDVPEGVPNEPVVKKEPLILRRSTRRRERPKYLIEGKIAQNSFKHPKYKIRQSDLNQEFLMSLNWGLMVEKLRSKDMRSMMTVLEDNTDLQNNTLEWMHPMALGTNANSSDNPNWYQAMNGPHKNEYWEACVKEHDMLIRKEVWETVEREEWMNVLPGTWAFKCKRYPDGTMRKFKARFCARGDKQIEGVDYFDTFAPVVNWTTVRVMLILSIILQLSTKQVDYTGAFVHAPIDKDPDYDNMTHEDQHKSGVFVEMPRGFQQSGKVLRLKKSLYGLKQSPRNFFKHLQSKLESTGFVSSTIDPCLFVSEKVICLVYVDDTLFYSPKKEWIDEAIEKLKAHKMELEVEDSVAGFLGVHIERNTDEGTIKLTQKGLITRIIETLDISHLPRVFTPAKGEPLTKDEEGDPAQQHYNYASVIGMLQYLSGHSRPDITYAVSSLARFAHCPKKSHENAMEILGRYLKGTANEGLILKPKGELETDVYVDSDFAGLWPYEDKQDSTCVKSRAGYVICLSNCPVIWISKLQQEVSLSTMEAEYVALSMCMKSVIPYLRILTSITKGIGISIGDKATFHTTVWEDNVGALTLANMEPGRITPRSKHYALKYHWFRQFTQKGSPERVEVKKIDTNEQRADILTKIQTKVKFEMNRKQLCGW